MHRAIQLTKRASHQSCLRHWPRAVALVVMMMTSALAQPAMSHREAATTLPAIDQEDIDALTSAQQKARQLATLLIGGEHDRAQPVQTDFLRLLAETTMQPHQRPQLTLLRTSAVEIRLAGAQQVLLSPVDTSTFSEAVDASEAADASFEADARRPRFTHPLQWMIGVEVIAR